MKSARPCLLLIIIVMLFHSLSLAGSAEMVRIIDLWDSGENVCKALVDESKNRNSVASFFYAMNQEAEICPADVLNNSSDLYKKNAKQMLVLADSGDMSAQYIAGLAYSMGLYFDANREKAKDYYYKAAMQNHLPSRASLKALIETEEREQSLNKCNTYQTALKEINSIFDFLRKKIDSNNFLQIQSHHTYWVAMGMDNNSTKTVKEKKMNFCDAATEEANKHISYLKRQNKSSIPNENVTVATKPEKSNTADNFTLVIKKHVGQDVIFLGSSLVFQDSELHGLIFAKIIQLGNQKYYLASFNNGDSDFTEYGYFIAWVDNGAFKKTNSFGKTQVSDFFEKGNELIMYFLPSEFDKGGVATFSDGKVVYIENPKPLASEKYWNEFYNYYKTMCAPKELICSSKGYLPRMLTSNMSYYQNAIGEKESSNFMDVCKSSCKTKMYSFEDFKSYVQGTALLKTKQAESMKQPPEALIANSLPDYKTLMKTCKSFADAEKSLNTSWSYIKDKLGKSDSFQAMLQEQRNWLKNIRVKNALELSSKKSFSYCEAMAQVTSERDGALNSILNENNKNGKSISSEPTLIKQYQIKAKYLREEEGDYLYLVFIDANQKEFTFMCRKAVYEKIKNNEGKSFSLSVNVENTYIPEADEKILTETIVDATLLKDPSSSSFKQTPSQHEKKEHPNDQTNSVSSKITKFFQETFSGTSNTKAVNIVRQGHLRNHNDRTVGDAIEKFFKNPTWRSGFVTSESEHKGKSFVNVEGNILFNNKEIKALIQFIVNEMDSTFQIYTVEFNEIPQNQLFIMALIEKMYG